MGGWLDTVIGRLIEVLLALPLIVVALLVLVALGPSSPTVIAVIGIIFTPLIARTVRAAVLSERSLDYVDAAELRGENAWHIMFVEILPNVLQPILVETTVRLGLRDLHRRVAQFSGLRHPATVRRLGSHDLGELRPDRRRLLVDRGVRCGGYSIAGRGGEPRGRWHPGCPRMTAALEFRDVVVDYRIRERQPDGAASRRVLRHRSRRNLRAGRGERLRQIDCRLRRPARLATQRHDPVGPGDGRRQGRDDAGRRRAAAIATTQGLDGVPRPGPRAEPRRSPSRASSPKRTRPSGYDRPRHWRAPRRCC